MFIFPAPNLSESTNKTKGDTSCNEEEARCDPLKTHTCGVDLAPPKLSGHV